MVSTYEDRSTAELQAVKNTLLEAIGGACDETAARIAAHLDAIEAQLARRRAGAIIVRVFHTEDEDGEACIDIGHYCPACDSLVRPT